MSQQQQLATVPARLAHFRQRADVSVSQMAAELRVPESIIEAMEALDNGGAVGGRRGSAGDSPQTGMAPVASRSPTTKARALDWPPSPRRGSNPDGGDDDDSDNNSLHSPSAAMQPSTDTQFWGTRIAALAMVLGRPVATLIPTTGKDDQPPASSRLVTCGEMLRKARGDRGLEQVAVATGGALLRDDLARFEHGTCNNFENALQRLSAWAAVCRTPIASLVF
jgi:hypothetical protein